MDENKQEELMLNAIKESAAVKVSVLKAIAMAKNKEFAQAKEELTKARLAMLNAHQIQTTLLNADASGENININLFQIHAQDHIMTSSMFYDLGLEIVELHEKMQ